jgi:TonB family protein
MIQLVVIAACQSATRSAPPSVTQRMLSASRMTLCADSSSEPGERPPLLADNQIAPSIERFAPPHYPDGYRERHIEGNVVLEFVVNTAGCAEADSRRVVSATDSAFAMSAWLAVRMSRYTPAQRAGHAVRAVVQQPFVFDVVH